MKITLSNEHSTKELSPEIISSVQKVLDEVKLSFESCISILVTDDEGIQRLNKEFRDINTPTDVLSFPAYNFEGMLADCIEDIDVEREDGKVFLGDIAISYDRAEKQALEYKHSFLREVCFLILHGVLHLIGYDHIDNDDQIIMEEKQKEILNIADIKRV